jgi:L-iditol 2-dehydrogenase
MSERFGVAAENLTDCLLASDLRPIDAALIEPLACVLKSVGMIPREARGKVAVVGLGSLGVTHLIVLGDGAVGYDVNPRRLEWARRLGLQARTPDEIEPADAVVVCVGSGPAIELGASIVPPGGTIVLFAPLAPGNHPGEAFNAIYFKDIVLRTTYSCGPDDTSRAAELLRHQRLRAEQVVSHFVEIEDLPMAYEAMKAGEILKAMVVFP